MGIAGLRKVNILTAGIKARKKINRQAQRLAGKRA